MTYKMKVTITKDGNEKTYDLDCVFFYEAEQYGNKHYLHIFGNEFYEKWLDIRYDTSFRKNEKAKHTKARAILVHRRTHRCNVRCLDLSRNGAGT